MKALFRIATIIAALSFSSTAHSDERCPFCTTKVALSQPLASCYLEKLEDELLTASSSGLSFHAVNLKACSQIRSDRGAQSMPDPRQKRPLETPTFLIAIENMKCLAAQITNADFETNAIVEIDLGIACGQ